MDSEKGEHLWECLADWAGELGVFLVVCVLQEPTLSETRN